MYSNVWLFGGFQGDETSLEQRNYKAHPTILDGHAASDPDLQAYNVLQCISENGCIDNVRLNGLTITGGCSNSTDEIRGFGAGMRIRGATVHIENCRFTENRAEQSGTNNFGERGGIYADQAFLTVVNSAFDNNYGESGGRGS